MDIPIKEIVPNPSQPRKIFQEEELKGLAESIRENGLLQPLVVRKIGSKYELIAGERRWRACQLIGLKTVSCITNDCNDRQSAIFAMLENLQRQDLQLFEEAEGIQKLIDEWGITQEEAAARLGKSQSTLANKMRLLKIPPDERKIITDANLTERHARALLRLKDEEQRKKVLKIIIEKEMNVQQTDDLIESLLLEKEEKKEKKKRTIIVKDIRIFMNTISHAVETMKLSGIHAITQKRETEDYIECIVRIPKKKSDEKDTEKRPA